MSGPRRKKAARAQPPRVALDTGVLLYALLLSDDKAKRLRQLWQGGACVPLVSAASAQALMRALAYPGLKLSAAQQHELLADFLPYAEVVGEAGTTLGRQFPAVLHLARMETARADFLVSDCAELRAKLARSRRPLCRLLGSEEFLASL
jgi:hypothetical protein